GAKLEVFSLITGFTARLVADEIAQAALSASPERAAAEARYLAAVAADGHHPELAEALSAPVRPLTPDATFARLLDRMVDGLDAGS
ncbi:TetR/AcrR family transcriptional regulator C-terminal domain-containing protein, partial [Streptomyces albiflaviniger]|nr:TetR/AcrR family transcriptional regulator C-terminal domain-containing protein [Streptomyces albiflaviniger]